MNKLYRVKAGSILSISNVIIFFLCIYSFIYYYKKINKYKPGIDFKIYYESAKTYYTYLDNLYPNSSPAFTDFIYPPPSIWIFKFFNLFNINTAYIIFISFMLLCLIVSYFITVNNLLPKYFNLSKQYKILLLLVSISSTMSAQNLQLGQINNLVLLLCLLFIFFFFKKAIFLASFLITMAIWLKIYPVFLVIPLITSPYFKKLLIYTSILSLIVFLLSLMVFTPNTYFTFFQKLNSLSGYTCSHIINQSSIAFLIRNTLELNVVLTWPNIFKIPNWIIILNSSLFLTVTLFLFSFRKYYNSIFVLFTFLAIIPMFSSLGWGHIFIFSLPYYLYCLASISLNKSITYNLFYLLFILIILVPVYYDPSFIKKLPKFIQNIFYSRLLFLNYILIVINFSKKPIIHQNLI